MLIRSADPYRDAAACAEIYAPFVRNGAVSFEEAAPDAREFSRRIAAISARYPWLVADVGGAVAAYAYASQHRERTAYQWSAEVAIYVGEAHRGQGTGKTLYGTLFDLLARQGVRTVCAGVTLPNPASVALHESCGFKAVGVYRRIGFKHGAWRDVGWWQLELPGGEEPPVDVGPPVKLEPRGSERIGPPGQDE